MSQRVSRKDYEQLEQEVEELKIMVNQLAGLLSQTQEGTNTPQQIRNNLDQNHPNPFSETTSISYTLETDGQVSLDIYTLDGRYVANLGNQYQPAGQYTQEWDAAGEEAGIYVYKLTMNGQVQTQKMVLAK